MKQKQIIPLIANEGLIRAAFPGVACVVLFLAGWNAPGTVMAAVTVAVLLFFRDPERAITADAGQILSPADGRVVAVDRPREDRYLGTDSLRVSVFMSIFNVHINRIPCDGKVLEVNHVPGGFRMAHLDDVGAENERMEVLLEDPGGRRSLMVQVAGLVARRIICRVAPGTDVGRGERYGLICFGSRVDLYLSSEAEARVRIGDRVRAGLSVVAELPAR
ncbi:MAG: phosphatidylserine decarboxylase family protein [bacterium]|nr:MAG: phosphatidylserine decarboxylase family protein [bacterium]